MSNILLELLSGLGHILDTPGAYTRGILSGSPGRRKSGEELLKAWGSANPHWGESLAAEVVADPLNLIPLGWGARAAKKIAMKAVDPGDIAGAASKYIPKKKAKSTLEKIFGPAVPRGQRKGALDISGEIKMDEVYEKMLESGQIAPHNLRSRSLGDLLETPQIKMTGADHTAAELAQDKIKGQAKEHKRLLKIEQSVESTADELMAGAFSTTSKEGAAAAGQMWLKNIHAIADGSEGAKFKGLDDLMKPGNRQGMNDFVRNYLRTRGWKDFEIDDVSQEFFLNLYKDVKGGKFAEIENPYALATTIMHGLSAKIVRGESRRALHEMKSGFNQLYGKDAYKTLKAQVEENRDLLSPEQGGGGVVSEAAANNILTQEMRQQMYGDVQGELAQHGSVKLNAGGKSSPPPDVDLSRYEQGLLGDNAMAAALSDLGRGEGVTAAKRAKLHAAGKAFLSNQSPEEFGATIGIQRKAAEKLFKEAKDEMSDTLYTLLENPSHTPAQDRARRAIQKPFMERMDKLPKVFDPDPEARMGKLLELEQNPRPPRLPQIYRTTPPPAGVHPRVAEDMVHMAPAIKEGKPKASDPEGFLPAKYEGLDELVDVLDPENTKLNPGSRQYMEASGQHHTTTPEDLERLGLFSAQPRNMSPKAQELINGLRGHPPEVIKETLMSLMQSDPNVTERDVSMILMQLLG